jgi:tRNA-Thr(GGU) m(6)t(6)A37 methyltransferase TsaA
MSSVKFDIGPIGQIRTDKGQTRLEIEKEFLPALQGLSGFSHVMVFFWCHLVDTDKHRRQLVLEKPYTQGPDKVGVFATRSPSRPNPIALTPVEVLHLDLDAGVIKVPFIDAEDNTPIIDLKPYQPCLDRIREVNLPNWCRHWPRWYEESGDFDWQAEFTFV